MRVLDIYIELLSIDINEKQKAQIFRYSFLSLELDLEVRIELFINRYYVDIKTELEI